MADRAPAVDLQRIAPAEPCRFCQRETFLADDEGPVHPCCAMWADKAPGEPCPSCNASRANRERQRSRRRAPAKSAEPKPRKRKAAAA